MTNEIRELTELIQHHDNNYYNGTPSISDPDYDGLRARLKALDPLNPVLHKVGATVVGDFKKVEHDPPMLSLNDLFEEADMAKWCNKYTGPFVAEMKMDGLAIEIEYVDGVFYRASTRGDGYIGDDVTHSVKTILNLPMILSGGCTESLKVRGEVVIPRSKFKLLEGFANPRNAAAGSVRQKDSKVSAQRHLAFYAYDIIGTDYRDREKMLKFVYHIGFQVVRQIYCEHAINVRDAYRHLSVFRKTLDYDIDGMVVKIVDVNKCDDIGVQGRYPKWAIACKFENPSAVTKLIGIELQKGRTGNITPVAILEPIEISGSTVRRASLHNQSEITRKGLYIGAMVTVEKAGEIIPEVVNVVSHIDANELSDPILYEMPSTCPDCGQMLSKAFLNWRCLNNNCGVEKEIEYFVSKGCMDIQGLGTKMIKQLVDNNLISSPVHIYKFLKDPEFVKNVMNLPGWSDGKVDKVRNSLGKRLCISAKIFYKSLGIPTIGDVKSQELADMFPNPSDFSDACELGSKSNLPMIGDVCYMNIHEWMSYKSWIIKALLRNVTIQVKIVPKVLRTFLFTGKISKPRSEYEKIVEGTGHKVAKSISKNVDYLVAGDKAGSKLQKAKDLGVKVITEEEFLKLI